MKSIKDILGSLANHQRAVLMYAFNRGDAQYVALGDGFYVGVNTDTIQNLKPILIAGSWSYGRITNENSGVWTQAACG